MSSSPPRPLIYAYSNISPSPGAIAGLVLGVIGAIAFAVLWLFCARRRQRKLRDAALLDHVQHASGPLEGEVLDDDDFAYGLTGVHGSESRGGLIIEERYAGILAALRGGGAMGAGVEQGSTTGVYGSHRDVLTDADVDLARTSSPTLPLSSIPFDEPPFVPLSPPPPSRHQQTSQPAPPPSAYFSSARRRSSPGPDASAWFGGYSVAPSCASHYAPSQTLGSGSGSGSVHALSRTQTGSEEPLLDIGKTSELSHGSPGAGGDSSGAAITGDNRLGLGSAFGSPVGSVYSPSASGLYHGFQGDTSGSSRYDMRSASGGSGYTRSATPSSFDVLRSVSSQGALSSVYSHGHGQNQGFRLGSGAPGSLSSGSTGKKRGLYRNSFGNPPTSFRAWKERGSGGSDNGEGEKVKAKREKIWRQSLASSASASGSADEKQGRSSPGLGVRALLGRLRRAGHTPSPRSSNRDLPSPGLNPTDVDKIVGEGSLDRTTAPPPPHITSQAATTQRAHYSFVLSNPDPHPPSPYSGKAVSPEASPPQDVRVHSVPDILCPSPNPAGVHSHSVLPSGYLVGVPMPSPVPTEESRIAEGLLHPRLRVDGRSNSSLRDFEDYSRPIGGLVNNRMYSTTTFGTVEDIETGRGQVTHLQDTQESLARNSHEQVVDVFGAAVGVQRESWFVDECTRAQDLRTI
ncbi:hypothetical protein F5I97DRAFT_1930468 [Phlebopus sp. FC_14]|nr:hypothetical protein F5I97DRAFT_1930468 [Phlebopus sp. FC_14]